MSGCLCIHGLHSARICRDDTDSGVVGYGLRPGQRRAVAFALDHAPAHLDETPELPFEPTHVLPLCGAHKTVAILGGSRRGCLWHPNAKVPALEDIHITCTAWDQGATSLRFKAGAGEEKVADVKGVRSIPGIGVYASDVFPSRPHPWRECGEAYDVQEVRASHSPSSLTLPGGPYSLIDEGGSAGGISVLSVDDIATLIFHGDLIQACMGDFRQCVYARGGITPTNPPLVAGEEPTICVTMIVRNESRIVCRALERVMSVGDAFCICDTGSTDSTLQDVSNLLGESQKPGHVFHVPFRDFGYNRTVSWLAGRGLATYQLFIDADHLLEVAPDFSKSDLTASCYLLQQTTHGCSYWNLRLARDDGVDGCVGSTHEFWRPASASQPQRFCSLHINDIGDGGAKADKFERDLCLLERQLLHTPECARTWFYLANTQRDRDDCEAAIASYRKRISLGGWEEEIWNSFLSIGRCYRRLGEDEKAVAAFLEAHEVDPFRIENLMELVTLYREKKKYVLGCRFAELAITVARQRESNPRLLFVEEAAFQWKLDYELSLTKFYAGKAAGHLTPVVDRSLWRLLRRSPLPEEHLASNHFFYSEVIDHEASSLELTAPSESATRVWACGGPVENGFFTISGWADKDGRTIMLWSQTGQAPSTIGALPAPGCTGAPPRIAPGGRMTLVMQLGGKIVGHTIWPEHRRLSPAFALSTTPSQGGIGDLMIDDGRPRQITSWFPFQVDGSNDGDVGACAPLWRSTRPVVQASSPERGATWLIELRMNPTDCLYAVMTADLAHPEAGAISRGFRFSHREDKACGLWVDKEAVHVVGVTRTGCTLHSIPIRDMTWMPIAECV